MEYTLNTQAIQYLATRGCSNHPPSPQEPHPPVCCLTAFPSSTFILLSNPADSFGTPSTSGFLIRTQTKNPTNSPTFSPWYLLKLFCCMKNCRG